MGIKQPKPSFFYHRRTISGQTIDIALQLCPSTDLGQKNWDETPKLNPIKMLFLSLCMAAEIGFFNFADN